MADESRPKRTHADRVAILAAQAAGRAAEKRMDDKLQPINDRLRAIDETLEAAGMGPTMTLDELTQVALEAMEAPTVETPLEPENPAPPATSTEAP